jgi:hypothetical protein
MKTTRADVIVWGLGGAFFGAMVACTPALLALSEVRGLAEVQWGFFLTMTVMSAVPGALVGGLLGAAVVLVARLVAGARARADKRSGS